MVGVLVNTGAIIVCSLLGLFVGKLLNERITKVVMQALGLAVLCVGIMDLIKNYNTLILVISLAVGGFIGSLCHIEDGIEKLGQLLETKLSKNPDGKLGKAFSTSTMIFCVGAMVVYGSIQDGLGNPETLYIKALLDGIMSLLLASTMGIGVMLSAIPVFVIQGAIALSAHLITPIVTEAFIAQLTGIGGALVICIGINILEIKKIHTADMLPAIFGAFAVFLL